ncbi:hypothetical protein U8C40_09495 [Sinorhizobium medicae]|nr:hypothetical protein U8C40_09495 [Sinorhizobium medicae]
MMALKAYAVLEKDEYTGDIYFAPRAIVAAKAGANEYGDGELSYIQCRRAPWADAFAGKGVPAKVAVDHGWHFECHGCGIQIDSDLEEEHRLPVDGIVGTMHGAVYCCARCKWKHMKREARRKQEEAAAIEDFKAIVRARFPDADFADDEIRVPRSPRIRHASRPLGLLASRPGHRRLPLSRHENWPCALPLGVLPPDWARYRGVHLLQRRP